MTPTAPRLTLIPAATTSPVAPMERPASDSSAPANAGAPSHGVVLLLDVLVRIEQRRRQPLPTVQTKAAS